MCQIIVISGNRKIEKEFLSTQYKLNNDGIGVVYRNKDEWRWKKFMSFGKFYEFYISLLYDECIDECIIHFRKASSGTIDITNVHPFLISPYREVDLIEGILEDGEVLLMQNGATARLPGLYKKTFGKDLKSKGSSDTKIWAFWLKNKGKFGIYDIIPEITKYDKRSRFVLVSNNEGVILLGNFIDYEGIKLSNSKYTL
jgi:predicted glutamine amidotransferase